MAKRQRMLYETQRNNRTADTNADVESDFSNAAFPAHGIASFTAPVRVHFHHTRARLADLDGLSAKALLDGLVAAGILADDSPEQIAEITHSQSKGLPEKTTVTITEV